MTRDVLYATAIAIAFMVPATAQATATQDALKVCTERYDAEKTGGSIPVGMSKSKYMSQCTNSIRRAARLEQELEQNSGDQGGTNNMTASTSSSSTTNKPSKVKTTNSLGLTQAPNH